MLQAPAREIQTGFMAQSLFYRTLSGYDSLKSLGLLTAQKLPPVGPWVLSYMTHPTGILSRPLPVLCRCGQGTTGLVGAAFGDASSFRKTSGFRHRGVPSVFGVAAGPAISA